MGRIEDLEGFVMETLSKIGNLIILNFITLICCLPVFTIGAAITSLNYMTIKIIKNEEGHIIKGFLMSFKNNFKQATSIWFIMLTLITLTYENFILISRNKESFPMYITIFILVVDVMLLLGSIFVFPVLSKFENTIINTIKNSFIMAYSNLPKTILVVIIYLSPVFILYYLTAWIPVVVFFGFSGPTFVASYLFISIFHGYESKDYLNNENIEYKGFKK